ncbi:hypothetical protein ACFX2J_008122 [Malus domestica]
MTLAAIGHAPPRGPPRVAVGRPRLAGKFNYFQKLPKFADLKISMSRTTFIPETKANLAWKCFNFTKTVKNPRIWVFPIRPSNLFQRLNYLLGFVLGPKGMLKVLVIERKHFKIWRI